MDLLVFPRLIWFDMIGFSEGYRYYLLPRCIILYKTNQSIIDINYYMPSRRAVEQSSSRVLTYFYLPIKFIKFDSPYEAFYEISKRVAIVFIFIAGVQRFHHIHPIPSPPSYICPSPHLHFQSRSTSSSWNIHIHPYPYPLSVALLSISLYFSLT